MSSMYITYILIIGEKVVIGEKNGHLGKKIGSKIIVEIVAKLARLHPIYNGKMIPKLTSLATVYNGEMIRKLTRLHPVP